MQLVTSSALILGLHSSRVENSCVIIVDNVMWRYDSVQTICYEQKSCCNVHYILNRTTCSAHNVRDIIMDII